MSCAECERRTAAARVRQRKVDAARRERMGIVPNGRCCNNCGEPGHYAPTCPVPLRGEP